MADLKQIVQMLEGQRRELVDQLAAVDKAIAALNGTAAAGGDARPAQPDIPTEAPPATQLARRVKEKRVLSDAHKQALIAGRRKTREAHDVAKGLAREMPDEGFVRARPVTVSSREERFLRRTVVAQYL